MSKLICDSAIKGAIQWVAKADALLAETSQVKGDDFPVAFPSTAYFLPVIYAFTGLKVETVADLKRALVRAKQLLPERVAASNWLPYLGRALDAGVASLFACEVIEACKYIVGPQPAAGIWLGAASDIIMRERGIEFVDGTAPGFAAITGAAPSNRIAVDIARSLQERNIYVFMAGSTGGRQLAEQLAEEGVQLGWETRLIPFGGEVSALIYALGFASRVGLSFGGIQPGDYAGNLRYNKNRVFAFVLTFGEVTPDKYALAAGAINYGFPVIADSDIPEILPSGVCTYEHVVANVKHDQMIEKALEVRGCKIKISEVPVPVTYGPAFEGERIRKENTRVEFGGNRSTAFEFVTSVGLDQINDGEIDIVGSDINDVPEGSALPLAIWVEVAGRKMQADFEPILERQIHHLLNGAEGIWHMGQRNIVWTRVSKDGFGRGLRLKHYGEIIHAKFLSEYPALVDKVKVTLVTEAEEVKKRLKLALDVYYTRDRRLEAMTDESIDTFYSCLLCQSFAPNHVCIVTPERLGLCGAYNWLDARAAHEIDETGPNQPVLKGECLDPVKGVWQGVDDYVYANSHKMVSSFSAYSIMDRPMTSCGCFEVILAYVPECNGVMAVNREFEGQTPSGMTFSTLAGSVGGGQQTPGFMGCGKIFLISKKFLAAEGGHSRLVWMPKELKELLKTDLNRRFSEQDLNGFMDQIADESVATDPDKIRSFMAEVKHPALGMEDMAAYSESAPQPLTEKKATEQPAEAKPGVQPDGDVVQQLISRLGDDLTGQLKSKITGDIVAEIATVLKEKYGLDAAADEKRSEEPVLEVEQPKRPAPSDWLEGVQSFQIRKEACEVPVQTVTLGATKKEGGTRTETLTIGGASCMPFHLWEGDMPHPPLVAMEVFDWINRKKFPPSLQNVFGNLLEKPAEMARVCVEKFGADLISVRLDGTHPERGNREPGEAVRLVKEVLTAVDVPLIVTGHSHFDSNNEVMKAVARECTGENLLLNWVEQDNYRTIAGAAIAYGHSLVAQSPIDVNIAKQMNILLTNMDIKQERLVMDPMTGAVGYGIEYTYSVMERIRQTALGGDRMLAGPMIVTSGQECVKLKELRATEKEMPVWGDLSRRTALWEMTTAINLLYAGADLIIMYHPEAVACTKKTIRQLLGREA